MNDCIHGVSLAKECSDCRKENPKPATIPVPVELARDLLTVLRDLGACDDPECTEPNCLHAASRLRACIEAGKK